MLPGASKTCSTVTLIGQARVEDGRAAHIAEVLVLYVGRRAKLRGGVKHRGTDLYFEVSFALMFNNISGTRDRKVP